MENMFIDCAKLKILDLSSFNTSRVTNMKTMFTFCRSLTNLDIGNFDTSKVTTMDEMFAGCYQLTSLNIENFVIWEYVEICGIFYDCRNLTTTITVKGPWSIDVYSPFYQTATENGAQITVNYSEEVADSIDKLIATKSSNANVVKGVNVSLPITIQGNDDVTSNFTKGYEGQTITLSYKDDTKAVASFKMNGTLITGDTFIMSKEEVTITDITLKQVIFDITVIGMILYF